MEAFTTKSSGIQYGLVKDHGNCDLETAKSRVANPLMRDHPYAVHVFRNVVEPHDEILQWTPGYVASLFSDALELSLQSIDDCRLYEKCKISIGEQHKGCRKKSKQGIAIGRHIFDRLNENIGISNQDEVECNVGVERHRIVSFMEQFFIRATQASSQFLYIYNCENPPMGITSCLNGISGHLNPANNSRIEEMAGINTSMFYVGSAGSFTELHVEDSIADSVNVIHAGKEKIWMIIHREDYTRTNHIVAQKLKNLQQDDSGDEETETCVLPLQHKNLVLTPRFLDEHKIRFEFVVQNHGDLLYVRYGILHQVVNVGVNVAEAINVGSHEWNFGNDLKMLCPCKRCQLIHAASNADVDLCVKVGKPKDRKHRCDVCTRIFATKQLLVKHRKDDHSAKHACRICDMKFQHTQSLNRHVRAAHFTAEENRMITTVCTLCNKAVADIDRHKRERHTKLVECLGCKTNFTRHDLATHEKACIKFTCSDCSNDFKSRHSLAIHRRWCRKEQGTTVGKRRKHNL